LTVSLTSSPSSNTFTPLSSAHALIRVERAISEMRSARPVVISYEGKMYVVMSAECFDQTHVSLFESFIDCSAEITKSASAYVALTASRLKRLGIKERTQSGIVALAEFDLERITHLALRVEGTIDAPVHSATRADEASLMLAHLSQLIPAVVCTCVEDDVSQSVLQDLLSVDAGDIFTFARETSRHVTLISRAPVPLEGAPHTEFVVFRGGEGLRDQVAIVVGKPDLNAGVHVRMHSACLTGDLFGSLKCDCGDQLRGSVRFMAENGGGILLYLDQEGRGNGIANKMRAYALQAKGWDTYDADEVFGMGMDQRSFAFAANMLKALGVSQVRLMTNNPIKIAALEDAGLTLLDNQRVLGRLTHENVSYLASKRERAGHLINTAYLNGSPSLSLSQTPPPVPVPIASGINTGLSGMKTGSQVGVGVHTACCAQPE
jgi:GTP cyclohydrolase II